VTAPARNRAALLAAVAALALPASAAAVERPEHTACTLSGVPNRMPMQEAFRKGIPATYTCHVAASPLVAVTWADGSVRVPAEERMAAIAHSHAAPPVPEVAAGTTRSIRLRILRRDRRRMHGHDRVRLLVEIASSLSGEMGPFYGASRFGRRITLVR
jgi:hypothetical protein